MRMNELGTGRLGYKNTLRRINLKATKQGKVGGLVKKCSRWIGSSQ